MKFVIESTYWNDEEKLLKYYPFLSEYGIETVEKECQLDSYISRTEKICYIHINNLEDLLRLKEQCDEELVVTDTMYTDEPCIEIYDGYRE